MVRASKLLIGASVVGASAVVGLAYTGNAAPVLTQSDLPGGPPVGFGAIFVLVFAGLLLSSYLDSRAWKRTGREVGLTPAGGVTLLSQPELTGTIRGRPVRAHTDTVNTGGGDGGGSSQTYTVIETDLQTPVEWSATFHPESGGELPEELADIGSHQWTTVGDIAVFGDVAEDHARAVLDGAVQRALTAQEGDVSVGDREQNLRQAMLETLDDGSGGGMAQSLAKGMLSIGLDEEAATGPSRKIEQRKRGLLVDSAKLERRIEAVAAVADAVERTTETVSRAQGSRQNR